MTMKLDLWVDDDNDDRKKGQIKFGIMERNVMKYLKFGSEYMHVNEQDQPLTGFNL